MCCASISSSTTGSVASLSAAAFFSSRRCLASANAGGGSRASETAPATHPTRVTVKLVLLTINPLSLIKISATIRDRSGSDRATRSPGSSSIDRDHPTDTNPASSQSTSTSTNSSLIAASCRRRNSAIVE